MSKIAIRVEGLGKQYRIGKRERYLTIRDSLTNTVSAPFRWIRSCSRSPVSTKSEGDLIWALKDVSFEVPRGAAVGIIGRNGAGKSTLLKILSRITEPTKGRAEIHGRVASLLEVGTGFHPELTGRDNIYLNGAILGMKKADIARRFDEIVNFAELDKFIDTPVKRYSSGMYMRLAFAVAAHLEPEILIVDEVLAVGDAQFQKKCLGKLSEVAMHGRTVLFVSHNMVAVNSMCNHALCLSSGRLVRQGGTRDVVAWYLNHDSYSNCRAAWTNPSSATGNYVCHLRQADVTTEGKVTNQIPLQSAIEIGISYWNNVPGALLNVALGLYSAEQICVFNVISPPTERPVGLVREVCRIPGEFLNTGVYRVQAMLVRDTANLVVNIPDIVSFEVFETARSVAWYGRWEGLLRPNLSWRSEVITADIPRRDVEFALADTLT